MTTSSLTIPTSSSSGKNDTWIYHEKSQELLYTRSTVSSRSRTKTTNQRQSLQIQSNKQLLQDYTRKRTCSHNELNYMKPTIADTQRRNSTVMPVATSSSTKKTTNNVLLPQRTYSKNRHSLVLVDQPSKQQPIKEKANNRRQSLIIDKTTTVEPAKTTSLTFSQAITRKVKGLSHLGIMGAKSYNAVTPQKPTHRHSMLLSPSKKTTVTESPSSCQGIQDTLNLWDKEMMEALSPGVPKSPAIAIKFYGHHLSPFEQVEIHTYSRIYFVGHQADKIHARTNHAACNYGYDDEHGNYNRVIHDHLAYRYEVIEELGRGSFGQVLKCLDHKTTSVVAIKLIRNKKKILEQAKYEVKLLNNLAQWDPEDKYHNLKMTDHFFFRNHLCIVTECLSMNLYEFIKSNRFRGFQTALIKRFAIQLLRSLFLLGKHGIIHCDLKPENILLKHPSKSIIKVIDFGSSCLKNQRVYTYIQSRFYRAPEIILGLNYTNSIDMWSLGCILAELYMGVPLFPGEDEHEQMACIMEVLGAPDQKLVQKSEKKNMFFDRRGEPKQLYNSRGKKHLVGTKTIEQVLSCDNTLFLDFIQQCLQWDPEKRLTPEKAFQHDWILSKV